MATSNEPTLEEENKRLKDENKVLKLYIAKRNEELEKVVHKISIWQKWTAERETLLGRLQQKLKYVAEGNEKNRYTMPDVKGYEKRIEELEQELDIVKVQVSCCSGACKVWPLLQLSLCQPFLSLLTSLFFLFYFIIF